MYFKAQFNASSRPTQRSQPGCALANEQHQIWARAHANRTPNLNAAVSPKWSPISNSPIKTQPALPVTLFRLGSCEYLRSMKLPGGAL